MFLNQMVFNFIGNFIHHFASFNRVFARGCFASEQNRVSTGVDCSGHITDFGARWNGVQAHRVQHLGGNDHGLAIGTTFFDERFCTTGTFCGGSSIPKSPRAAKCHPHLDDGIHIFNGFRFFNFGNHLWWIDGLVFENEFFNATISSALRTNDNATKSTLFFNPQIKSSRSLPLRLV